MIKTLFIRSGTARISFGVEVALEEPVNTILKWGIVLQPNVAKNQLHLVSEEIVDLDTKETLVQYKASAGGRIKGDNKKKHIVRSSSIE